MGVSNSTEPQNSVKSNFKFKEKTNAVSVELNSYKNWTHCTKVGDFTNHFQNNKEVGKVYFQLVDRLLPFIKEKGPDIKQERHCHQLKGDKRELAMKIASKLHNLVLGEDTDIWQLACGQGIRLIAAILFTGDNENVYPLFLDPHHLIYPDENHNQNDYKSKACRFDPSKFY